MMKHKLKTSLKISLWLKQSSDGETILKKLLYLNHLKTTDNLKKKKKKTGSNLYKK